MTDYNKQGLNPNTGTPAFMPIKTEAEKTKEDLRKKFTIRLNDDQMKVVKECQKVLHQKKVATTIKQIFFLGANDLLDEKMIKKLDIIYKNKVNNKRNNVMDFD